MIKLFMNSGAADGRKLRAEYRLNNFQVIEADKSGTSESDWAEQSLADGGMVVGPGISDSMEVTNPRYTTLSVRDYCGSYIYKNGSLERIMTENGYWQDGELFFYVKDYQGNVRVVLNQQNQPVELDAYYPYGMLMAATPSDTRQPHKYGAKELDRENGLDSYDSQARWYDSQTGRTHTIDPMAEKYPHLSPYLWCAANPIKFGDEFGDTINVVFDKSTNTLQILDMDRYDPRKPLNYVSSKDYDFNKNNQVLVIHNVFSGGESRNGEIVRTKKEHNPIPNGVYDILENKGDTNSKHKGWLRLDAQDNSPRNDKHDETGRNGFRLHTGTNSFGCVTIDRNSKNSAADWAILRKMITQTSFITVGERRGLHIFLPFDNLKKYGRLTVHE